jgi:hypothetical protein
MSVVVTRSIEVKNSVASGAGTEVADLISCEVQTTGTFSQTMVLQGSNDNTNWVDLTSITSAGLTVVSKKWGYLRCNTTVHSSGSALMTVCGRKERSKLISLDTATPPATPSAPTVTDVGTAGSTTYGYKIVAKTVRGFSAASSEGTDATGNATLSATNYETITWTAVTGALSYDVYRTTGGATQGLIGNTTELTFNDTGLVGDASTAPTTRQNLGAAYGVYEQDVTTRSLQVVSTGTATLILEGSMDGTTWTTDQDVSAGGQFDVTRHWSLVRINITTYTSGTMGAVIVGERVPRFPTFRTLDAAVPVATPSAPVITNVGTAGSTAYSYKVVAKNAKGSSAASAAGSTATGNATLTTSNYNTVTWTAVTGATAGYDVYRTASSGTPSSTGLIGSVAAGVLSLDDKALAGDSSTAPTNRTSTNLDIYVGDISNLHVETQGAQSGNLDIQGSIDGTNYVKIGSSVTGAADTDISTSTLLRLRLKWSSYTSGTPTATVYGELPLESVPS